MGNRGYILDIGLLDYKRAWDLQHLFWSKRVEERLPDLLLIVEHPHVITLGRRGNSSSLLVSQMALKEMGIPLYQVERGGDVTYHGPGQLVGYPILNLKEYGYRVAQYVDELEEILLLTLRDFGIDGRREIRNRGVWVQDKKIASIGIAIQRWVSFHGFALNYQTELKYFDLIYPCGLKGIKMTSMEEILGKRVSRELLVERISLHFKGIFEREWEEKSIEEIEKIISEENQKRWA